MKGGSNSAREDFSKNVANAVDKHAAKASSKRDVQINTSFEAKTESGTETSIVRELQNINVGRTLNFVFRQMNQEYISILHLVDVRLAFFNGFAESRREVALHDIDSLLDAVVIPSAKATVRDTIISELQTIFDYQDKIRSIVEDRALPGGGSYLRVRKDLNTTVTVGDDALTVLGIPLRVDTRVLRTEGVIAEALLGQGNALDPYSEGLQGESVRAKVLANDVAVAQTKRETLAQTVVNDGNAPGAKLFAEVFPCCNQVCCYCGQKEPATANAGKVPNPSP